MKAAERAAWVGYILKREFEGHGWSKWLLTHPSPGVQTADVAQRQRAQDGVEAEIASRRMALEVLSDDALERAYLRARVRELEVHAKSCDAKAKDLKHENAGLRSAVAAFDANASLDPRERASLLKVVGALIVGYNNLVEDYNATERPKNHAPSRKRKLDTSALKDAVAAIQGMAEDMPDVRTVRKYVERAISMTASPPVPANSAKT